MLVVEVRSVSIEPIGDEHRDIIRPAVPGGGAEQNPLVILRNFVERFHPENKTCPASVKASGVSLPEWVVSRRGSPPSLATM